MRQDDPILNEVATFLSHSLEGDISTDEFECFEDLLQKNSQARMYYYRLLSMHATLQKAESILLLQDETSKETCQEVLEAFLLEEKTAPTIEIPLDKQEKAVVHTVFRKKVSYKISRFSLITFTISTAAILFFALLLRFGPAPRVEVATVTSSMDSVFADGKSFSVDSRLSTGANSLWLQKGTIEVTFDYGARVVIEAPAQFNLNSAENITLYSGRLYAHVPQRSKGFVVETPSSRVIDLGTEFGIKVDYDGSSDVYMMKGKASVFSGSKGQTGRGQILIGGEACRVDSKGEIETIPMREEDFVRVLLPGQSGVWRGQDVDLADIVGGGNGFGTGQIETAIDPLSGTVVDWDISPDRRGQGQYVSVKDRTCIDGVFVPNGRQGPVQVTSAGHKWNAPNTANFFKYNIVNSVLIPEDPNQYRYVDIGAKSDQMIQRSVSGKVPRYLMKLNAMSDQMIAGTNIFMHANLGMSFDLDEIRKYLPSTRILKFKSSFGVGEGFYKLEQVGPEAMHVDVWVLVDGKPKLSKREIDATMLVDIEIELSETDRFLTLAVTDSSDNGDKYSYSFDWGLFMNPRLVVE